MPREATLFNDAKGSVLEAFFLLKGNIPPQWIKRSRKSRKFLENEVARILRKGDLNGLSLLREWEEKYTKECFYYGLRVLLELKRKGKTKY